MTITGDKQDDKPVFKVFDESKGPRKWFYYLPDQDNAIMVRPARKLGSHPIPLPRPVNSAVSQFHPLSRCLKEGLHIGAFQACGDEALDHRNTCHDVSEGLLH